LLIVLEGGYSFDNLRRASEGVLRILLGDKLPLACSEWSKNESEIYESCFPSIKTLEIVDS
jgi:hypothetical protein